MADNLHNAPIVLDNGSGTIRAGFAGDDLPKCYFPSFVGRPKHLRVLAGALEGVVFIGQRAQELRGLLKIRYPLEHGIVTDWDDMERIWEWVYGEGLKTLSEEVRMLLLAAIYKNWAWNLVWVMKLEANGGSASGLINRATAQPTK
jgi:centractin